MKSARGMLCCLLLFAGAQFVRAENWPQWRGSAGNGVSQETETPLVWSESRSLAWKCDLPFSGDSTPVVWNDAVFVTGQTKAGELVLARVNTPDGKIVWQRTVGTVDVAAAEAPAKKVSRERGPQLISPSPATDGKYVVASFPNGDFAAFDLEGKQFWKHNLQEAYGRFTDRTGHANSPVLFKNFVISTCLQQTLAEDEEQPAGSYLVAHDMFSGRERWRTERTTKAAGEQCESAVSPLLLAAAGKTELIVFGGNQLDSYDPSTGKQNWFLPSVTGGRTVSGMTTGSGLLFVTRGSRGPTLGIKFEGAKGELPRRNIDWERPDSSPATCSPVYWSELLFTITDDGVVRCINAPSGHIKWKHRLPGNYKSSPIISEGRLYFLNTEGLCTILSAAPYYDKLVENKLDDEFVASPAISGGTLYLRGNKRLYAIRK